MVAASTWRPRQPSFEGTNATDQTSTAPATRTPGPAREMVRQIVVVSVLQRFDTAAAVFYVLWPLSASRSFGVDCRVELVGVCLNEGGVTGS